MGAAVWSQSLEQANKAPPRGGPGPLGRTSLQPPLVPRRVRIGADLASASVSGVGQTPPFLVEPRLHRARSA
ncbi:MAG: hypothetical protein AUG84_01215 [Chloroflexi bacterium 13_1_20CM_4_66_7]|nr:MAG: hypothetical protein AUG84_01215 [Chloroflexi bacterium 13_1_20CM_4_66_7]